MYVIKYLQSTINYHGIAFLSDTTATTTGLLHFLFHHNVEAFKDTLAPTAAEHDQLKAYSEACWGSQIGSLVPVGTNLEMFQFRSMSGYLILWARGPIAQSAICQEYTSQSSYEAEVWDTDKCIKDILSIWYWCDDICLLDNTCSTKVFNDNQGCVRYHWDVYWGLEYCMCQLGPHASWSGQWPVCTNILFVMCIINGVILPVPKVNIRRHSLFIHNVWDLTTKPLRQLKL